MSAPFLAAFEEQKTLQANYKEPAGAQQQDLKPAETKGDLKVVRYREEEAMFIQASNDRVTVIFSTVFKEETDRVYGRVFLQVCGSTSLLTSVDDLPGVCGCAAIAELAECASGHLLEPRPAS